MKKITPYFLTTCLVIISAALSLSSTAQQGHAANVNVAIAQDKELAPVAWVSGSIVSRNNSKIAAEVSGRLLQLIAIGSAVKKDQTIAELDARSLKIQRREQLADVENNQAKLNFEQAEVVRKQTLVEKRLISKTELEETIANRNIANASLAAARARLAQTEQNIAFTRLKAPFAGIVAERLSNQGEYVNSGDAIVRLVETDNVEAAIFAPLTSYKFLKASEDLNIRSPLGNAQAPVKAIIPISDTRSHLMEVRLDMSAIDWPIGLNIKAAVATGKNKTVLAIPRDALVLRRDSTSVFRIDSENTAHKINVSVGIGAGELVEVIGDIKKGDKVVIRGAERLRDGQKVTIKNNNQVLISGNK